MFLLILGSLTGAEGLPGLSGQDQFSDLFFELIFDMFLIVLGLPFGLNFG